MRCLPPYCAPGFWLGAFFFALSVAYLPGAFNASTAGRWALLSIGVPLLLWCAVLPPATLAHQIGAVLLGWAALSLWWTPSIYDGLDALWKLFVLAGLFLIGTAQVSLRPVFVGLGIGMAVNAGIAIAQWYGWEGIYTLGVPAGLYINKNSLAEAAALTLIGVIGYRLWWLVPAVLPCIVLTGGRAAMAGLAVAAMAWLWPRSRLAVLTIAGVGLAYCIGHLGDFSVADRFDIWRDTMAGLTPLGRGVGSFFTVYPENAFYKDLLNSRPAHAHNDFLEMAFDLGPAVILYVALLAVALAAPRPVERAVLLAFTTEACFAFPLHLPVTAAVAALAAGHLCGAWAPVRHSLADRRVAYGDGALAFPQRNGSAGASAAGARGVSA